MQLIVCVFDGATRADEVKHAIQNLDKRLDTVKLGNIAIVRKGVGGKITFDETEDIDARRGALFGAVAGGLMGLVALSVPGAAMIGTTGAAVGGITANSLDMGFPDRELKQIGEGLEKGSSAFISLVRDGEEATIVIDELERLGGTVMQHTLAEQVLAQLTEMGEIAEVKKVAGSGTASKRVDTKSG
jgi:uncharacterized membrane protein